MVPLDPPLCTAACAEGVSPFVNDDKFSVIKDSFNDDNTKILLLLLNYHYDFCHIGPCYLIGKCQNRQNCTYKVILFYNHSSRKSESEKFQVSRIFKTGVTPMSSNAPMAFL